MEKCLRVASALMGLGLFLVGCGPDTPEPAGAAGDVSGSEGALLAGSVDLSRTVPNHWSLGESETSSAKLGAWEYVAFNSEDPLIAVAADGHSYTACQGAIGVGYSFNSGGAWTQVRPPMPSGMAMTWGDPAVGFLGFNPATATVFLAELAVTQGVYNAATKGPNGCPLVSTGKSFKTMGNKIGAAVMRSTPGGTFTTAALLGDGWDVDGGRMVAVGSSMYFSYVSGTSTVTFSLTATGPPVLVPTAPVSNVTGHPILVQGWVANQTGVTMVVPTGGSTASPSTIKLTTFQPSTQTWTTPLTVATDFDRGTVFMKGTGKGIRTIGFDATNADLGGSPKVDVFYQTKTNGFARQRGVVCHLSTIPPSCVSQPTWLTPAGNNTFAPVVRQTSRADAFGNPSFKAFVSYWSDEGRTDGKVRLRFTELNSTFTATFGSPQQEPCPDTRGYWGDYDGTFLRGRGTNLWASLNRSFTDSTDAGCVQKEFVATPRHVSLATFTPP